MAGRDGGSIGQYLIVFKGHVQPARDNNLLLRIKTSGIAIGFQKQLLHNLHVNRHASGHF